MKIGVFGVGHLGKIHLRCLEQTPWTVAGVYDPDPSCGKWAEENYGIKSYTDPKELLAEVDAVDIVSTTVSHYEVAMSALRESKHVFVEKPISHNAASAKALVDLAKEKNSVLQVGHVERYNPAYRALEGKGLSPQFIEGHRLTTFNTRGNDVSVVHDLMIHDLDLVLAMVDSDIKDIQANGVCVVNATPDICNVRLSFENGAVANLTASRISMKNMRKIRLFQDGEYISLDLLKKESQVISISTADEESGMTIETSEGKKSINIDIVKGKESNAIVEELTDFYHSVKNNQPAKISGLEGYRALQLAEQIETLIHQNNK